MSADPLEPVTVASARTEFEAAAITSALREQGIDARAVGGMTAGFRAETPGDVRVMVLQRDLERARLALRAIKADSVDLPWDQVDTGAMEAPPPDAPVNAERRWAWTLVLACLLPLGAFLMLLLGGPDHDPVARAIGPTMLAAAAILGVSLWTTRGDADDAESR